MLPYINTENWLAFHFSHIHQRIVLVGCGNYFQLAIFCDQPGPAASKSCCTCCIEFLLEIFKRSKSAVDRVAKFSRRFASAICGKDFPKKTMIPVSTAIVANSWRNLSRTGE